LKILQRFLDLFLVLHHILLELLGTDHFCKVHYLSLYALQLFLDSDKLMLLFIFLFVLLFSELPEYSNLKVPKGLIHKFECFHLIYQATKEH
jgi:hypothetical protein